MLKRQFIISLFIGYILLLCVSRMPAAELVLLERHGPPGSIIHIPCKIYNTSGLAGGEILFKYDRSILDFMEIDSMDLSNDFYIESKFDDDEVAISFARADGLDINNGILFSIKFRIKVSAQINASSEITFEQWNLYDEDLNPITCSVEHGVMKVTSNIVVHPNPFTPNNDGYNDVAYFVIPESLSGTVKIDIFNLFGRKIKGITAGSNIDLQWDGFDDEGKASDPGVYIYYISSNNKELLKGTITIMR